MLAMALDRARDEGYDLAYLFSDIRPQFYAALGFRTLPSRRFSLHADALPATRLEPTRLTDDDWSDVRHVFELAERSRASAFIRTATVWDWIQLRARHGSEHPTGDETNLLVRRRRGIAAYVFGVRDPQRDDYILDEFAFADDAAAAAIPALLRAAAGDLRRVTGWLPPQRARDLLPEADRSSAKRAILMMARLRSEGELLLSAIAPASSGELLLADRSYLSCSRARCAQRNPEGLAEAVNRLDRQAAGRILPKSHASTVKVRRQRSCFR